ncbi:SDR family NAD(P)-dependent oxidoreductase [Paenibacillus agilis]|uniref:SDR family oxidoreductase n=1 Tax=Paenibacillus agilis TaxID=3020863 RepID=A0A559IQ82_9BACL|nr:SDR family oxidoreductase [Paenibacillus agilis]TVX89693.1 SDR family oxidoreductase [Paenibacillus agilis]
MELAGKKVVITGASRGLGQALAIHLAKMGAQLFLSARTTDSLNETCRLVEEATGQVPLKYAVDLRNPQQIRSFAEAVEQESADIDILINNGAMWLAGEFDSVSDEEISDTINSAAVGTTLITRHFLPMLRRSKGADIVNMISVCGLLNVQHESAHEAFHAAKFAQAGFTDRLRHRLKPEGIRVIGVYPPDFDDVSPVDPEWSQPRNTRDGQSISNRHVVEAITFALTRDRICSINSIQLDTWPSA